MYSVLELILLRNQTVLAQSKDYKRFGKTELQAEKLFILFDNPRQLLKLKAPILSRLIIFFRNSTQDFGFVKFRFQGVKILNFKPKCRMASKG